MYRTHLKLYTCRTKPFPTGSLTCFLEDRYLFHLSNSLQICCLTEGTRWSDWSWYFRLSGTPGQWKHNLYDSPALHMFLFMSSYLCLGIHPVMLGHRGHFLHSSEDMPIHAALPTFTIYRLPLHFRSRCAVPPAQSELPTEARALPWQGARRPVETDRGQRD